MVNILRTQGAYLSMKRITGKSFTPTVPLLVSSLRK